MHVPLYAGYVYAGSDLDKLRFGRVPLYTGSIPRQFLPRRPLLGHSGHQTRHSERELTFSDVKASKRVTSGYAPICCQSEQLRNFTNILEFLRLWENNSDTIKATEAPWKTSPDGEGSQRTAERRALPQPGTWEAEDIGSAYSHEALQVFAHAHQ